MPNRTKIHKAIWCRSNIFLITAVYLILAIYFSAVIFEPNNLALTDKFSKILSLVLVWFVFAPAFSIGALLSRLRFQHFIKTKDFSEFLTPTKGTLANPYIEDLIGLNGKKLLSYSLKIVIFFLLGSILVISILRIMA